MKMICYPLVRKLLKRAWDLMSVKSLLKEKGFRQEPWLPGKEI